MNRIECTSCGARVVVPVGHARAKLRCESCGYYVEVPEKFRGDAVVEETATSEKSPVKQDRAPPAPLLVGSQDEDDGQPYGVPGDLTRKCSSCHRDIDYDATFCIHCGTDFKKKTKAKKTYEPIDRQWTERFTLDLRLKAFAACQIINVILAILTGSVSGGIAFCVINGGLQAFILGTFNTIRVQRAAKGTGSVTILFRLGFIPLPPREVDWKASAIVGIIAVRHSGFAEWFAFVYLLFCGILPGIVFYAMVIRPDRFLIALADHLGSTNEILVRTTQHEVAEEIATCIRTATGLQYRPVL